MSISKSRKLVEYGQIALYFVIIFIAWEVYISVAKVPNYILPSPSRIANAFSRYWALLLDNSWITIFETISGFLLGAAVGISIAILIVYSPALRRVIMPIIISIQSIPKVAIAPIIVIWVGVGVESKIAMAFLISFFPMIINTTAGLENIDPYLLELVSSMKARKLQIFYKIRLPNSLPFMFEGFKISMPLSVIGAIVGEYIGATEGLGNLILISSSHLKTELVFATLAVITIISIVLFQIIVALEKIVIKWRPK